MDKLMLTAKDVNWVYNERTGAIPFIINEKKNRVKTLEDGIVLDILDKNQSVNPLTAAVKTFSDYYEKAMSYVGSTAMFAHVNMFQNLQHFSLKKLDDHTPLNMEQIKFLTENYNRKIDKVNMKQMQEKAKQQAQEEVRQKTFNF